MPIAHRNEKDDMTRIRGLLATFGIAALVLPDPSRARPSVSFAK